MKKIFLLAAMICLMISGTALARDFNTPQKEDLIEFTATSGCNKIVCIIVSDVVDDQRNSGKHRQQNRISVQLDAYLCTSTNIADVFSASKEVNSKGSALRARSGAFKKCLNEISKSLNKYI